MKKYINPIVVFLLSIILCLLNKRFNYIITEKFFHWFMTCYFNDIIGAIAYSAYCDIAFMFW